MKGYLLASALIVAFAGAGCGDTKTSSANTPNTTSSAPPPPAPAPNAVPPAPRGNTGPSGSPGLPGQMRPPRQMPRNPPGTPFNTTSAPDNSEVVVTLARDLVKTRTFKSHPTLIKVEEITDGMNINKKTIKVYLK